MTESSQEHLIQQNNEINEKKSFQGIKQNNKQEQDDNKYENMFALKNLIEKFVLQIQQGQDIQMNNKNNSVIQKIKSIVEIKSNSCSHKYGCIDNLYLKTLRGFLISYIGYCGLSAFQSLKKKNFKLLVEIFFRAKTLRFTLFLSLMNFWVNSIQCLLRNKIENFQNYKNLKYNKQGRENIQQSNQTYNPKLKNQNQNINQLKQQNSDNSQNQDQQQNFVKTTKQQEKIITMLAGAIGGFFALATQPNSQRKTWVIFTLTRALDFIYNNMVIKKKIPEFKGFYVILFSLINMLTVYAYSCDNSQVFSGLTKFYTFVFNPNENDTVFMCATQMTQYRWLKENGIVEGRAKNLAYAKSLSKSIQKLFEKGNIKV